MFNTKMSKTKPNYKPDYPSINKLIYQLLKFQFIPAQGAEDAISSHEQLSECDEISQDGKQRC